VKKEIVEIVHTKIHNIRDSKVMIDSDIAELYGVETKRINEAVKNNPDKFPNDFYFELTYEELEILKSKFSTSSWGGRRKPAKVFTEQGVYMLATILKSKTATDVTVAIMRAFVKLREFSLTYGEILDKLNKIDSKVVEHEEVLSKVIQAITTLVEETKTEETKKVGFITDER
jgi:hypothetical protein